MKKVHFISIGGSIMHNLAIALYLKGYSISGSDDEIFEPSRSKLDKYGLLPDEEGWHPERIHSGLDAVILGMHAKAGNPELERARSLNIPIYSFPEFLYNQSRDKTRVVIGGSHGKTTITAMIMHVMRSCQKDFDYLVGASLEGFDIMVKTTDEAPVMILEGDEYLTSALDPRPKFHLYKPHIALLSGISWDHINVFRTFPDYVKQFRKFLELIEDGGRLIYFEGDETVKDIVREAKQTIDKIPYGVPEYMISDGITSVNVNGNIYRLKVFGRHNLANMEGARKVCGLLGVGDESFFNAIQTFSGAAKRLEMVYGDSGTAIFNDFAHAPSKLKASVEAVKTQYPDRKLVACMELHTYSSLSHEFLDHYRETMVLADQPIIYYNPHAIKLKGLKEITRDDIRESFSDPRLIVFNDSAALKDALLSESWDEKNLLMMSSGNFGGIDIRQLSDQILKKKGS